MSAELPNVDPYDGLQDPSTLDGFRVIYDREVSAEIRQDDAEEHAVGEMQALKVKVLLLGGDDAPEAVRLEASSEGDLFFHYYHTLDFDGFHELKARQKLMIEFCDYPNVLVRMLNNCIKEPATFMSVMYVFSNATARLDFIQNMEYKFVELLSVDFIQSPAELIRMHIAFRYAMMKGRVGLLQGRLHELQQLIKLKNPSLLLQLQRSGLAGDMGDSPKRSRRRG